MSELVTVETHTAISTFRSSGGYETAVSDFLTKHKGSSAGTVMIRKEKRTWYTDNDKIIIIKDEEEPVRKRTKNQNVKYPTCPDCGLNLDPEAVRCTCGVCGKLVTIEKKGEKFFTRIDP